MSVPLNPSGQLGQNSFLQLMVDEMKNQDPLNAQSNTQFLAQLAQFTSVEQMTNVATQTTQLNTTMTTMEQMTNLMFEHQLLGTSVTVTDAKGNAVTGTVSAIAFNSGNPELVVNGQNYAISSLTGMS